MENNVTELLNEYAQLKLQETLIKEQLQEIAPDVTDLLQELGGKVEVPGGEIGLTTVKKWSYPKYIQEAVAKRKQEITEMEKIYQIKNPNSFDSTQVPRFYKSK